MSGKQETTRDVTEAHTSCPHTSMHGVELEHRRPLDGRRSNLIGPDVWECDGCLTLMVEDSVTVLDSHMRVIRAAL